MRIITKLPLKVIHKKIESNVQSVKSDLQPSNRWSNGWRKCSVASDGNHLYKTYHQDRVLEL